MTQSQDHVGYCLCGIDISSCSGFTGAAYLRVLRCPVACWCIREDIAAGEDSMVSCDKVEHDRTMNLVYSNPIPIAS
jgi:hypothetical protein